MLVLILIGVAMADLKLWQIAQEQYRHNKAVESLLGSLKPQIASQEKIHPTS
jgi:hypothetical protein